MEPTTSAVSATLIRRYFTVADEDPFSTVEWGWRDAKAGDFFQPNVECPLHWTDDMIGVVAKLYFATVDGVKENSVRQMVHRVARKLTDEGLRQGHFDADEAETFYDELVFIVLHGYAAFNTPVWLNLGVPGRKQTAHACFLLSIKDKMLGEGGITDWWDKEATIFKSGSGAGINLSNLRGSMEPLSTGGIASGPVAYMRSANAAAETLKSGGAHRRAAKFVCLDADHPDILDFIWCKVREDERMRALMDAGFDLTPYTAEGERNVAEVTSFQSANNSVCLSDEFMRKATGEDPDPRWPLIARVTGEVIETVDARDLLLKIAEASWRCADPGVVFTDTMNAGHTTPSLGPISTLNTCGEIAQNDDTACNLCALNVLRFVPEEGGFDVDSFRHVADMITVAMDINCGFSELPTERIQRNTRDLRQLGVGFTNIGAAIMAQAMPYDSDEGRQFARDVTALLTGRVYRQSARMAEAMGPFARFDENRSAMLAVLSSQAQTAWEEQDPSDIMDAAGNDWLDAMEMGGTKGFRNSLATAMMPAGTCSYIVGYDTTGIEPAFALVSKKKLAAAGEITIVSRSAIRGARTLGYSDDDLARMEQGDFSIIRDEHRKIFATSIGDDAIDPMAHVKMVAAIQPFVSQSISKTTNVPNDATVDDIMCLYEEAWRSGLKVLSVYRDGSKATQVLTASTQQKDEGEIPKAETPYAEDRYEGPVGPERRRLPREREAIIHKFNVDGHEGYVTAGKHPGGDVGEIFISGIGKEGSTLLGMMNAWAIAISMALQYGVPLEVMVRKFSHMRFEPEGQTENPEIRVARSLPDYIMRWLASRFLDVDICDELGIMTEAVKSRRTAQLGAMSAEASVEIEIPSPVVVRDNSGNGVLAALNGHAEGQRRSDMSCRECGGLMMRTGACLMCPNCGFNTGCG